MRISTTSSRRVQSREPWATQFHDRHIRRRTDYLRASRYASDAIRLAFALLIAIKPGEQSLKLRLFSAANSNCERNKVVGRNISTSMEQNGIHYDAIVIGSGQGGNPLAQKLGKRGERVALIERKDLGGTCVNTGCTPTKMYVASAQVAHYARHSSRWGVEAGQVAMNMPAVISRKNEYVNTSRGNWEKKFEENDKVDLFRGSARFVAPLTLQVNGKRLTGNRIFIDTGTDSVVPNIEGLKSVPFLTNESLLQLTEVPAHLLVLGAGYIGLEFGQIFRRFGSEVTIVGNANQVLEHEDKDVADALQQALEAEGIRFQLASKVTAASYEGDSVSITTSKGETFQGSHLLLAAGRAPNTSDLDLAKAGRRGRRQRLYPRER